MGASPGGWRVLDDQRRLCAHQGACKGVRVDGARIEARDCALSRRPTAAPAARAWASRAHGAAAGVCWRHRPELCKEAGAGAALGEHGTAELRCRASILYAAPWTAVLARRERTQRRRRGAGEDEHEENQCYRYRRNKFLTCAKMNKGRC